MEGSQLWRDIAALDAISGNLCVSMKSHLLWQRLGCSEKLLGSQQCARECGSVGPCFVFILSQEEICVRGLSTAALQGSIALHGSLCLVGLWKGGWLLPGAVPYPF